AMFVTDFDAVGALAFLGRMRAHRAMAELAWRGTVMGAVLAWPVFGGSCFACRRVAGSGGFARMRRPAFTAAALTRSSAFDALARSRLVLLDQLLEFAEAALGQRVADALLELADAHVVDHLDRRQLHLLDRLAGGALDRAQHAALARTDEQDRLAAAAGAAGAADAVHVAFGVVRDVVIEHVADPLHVEAARGNVGGDQDVELAVLQLLDDALA